MCCECDSRAPYCARRRVGRQIHASRAGKCRRAGGGGIGGGHQLGEEVPAPVEEEDVIMHEKRVLGLDERNGLEPGIEWIDEGVDRNQLQPFTKLSRGLLQL